MKTCREKGCREQVKARGLCAAHYQRGLRAGVRTEASQERARLRAEHGPCGTLRIDGIYVPRAWAEREGERA